MPKNDATDEPQAVATPQPSAPDAFNLTLQEFCTRLSAEDGRVEMIAGFEYSEKKAGHFHDSADNFTVRYVAFQTQPA